MKRVISFLFISTLSLSMYAQTLNRSLPAYNIFGSADYTIEAETKELYVTKYIIKTRGKVELVEFVLSPNNLEAFKKNFGVWHNSLKEKLATGEEELNNEATRLFYIFLAAERTVAALNDAPDAGELCFNEIIDVSRSIYSPKEVKRLIKELKDRIKRYERAKQVLDSTIFKTVYLEKLTKNMESSNKKPEEVISAETEILIKLDSAAAVNVLRPSISIAKKKDAWVSFKEKYFTENYVSVALNSFDVISKGDYQKIVKGDLKEKEWTKLLADKVIRDSDDDTNSKIAKAKTDFNLKQGEFEYAKQAYRQVLKKIRGIDSVILKKEEECTKNRSTGRLDHLRMELSNTLINGYIKFKDTLKMESKEGTTLSYQELLQTFHALTGSLTQANKDAFNAFKTDYEAKESELKNADAERKNSMIKCDGELNYLKANRTELNIELEKMQVDSIAKSRSSLEACAFLSRVIKDRILNPFKVKSIEVEFNDGFIENIVAEGELQFSGEPCPPNGSDQDNKLKFNNRYSVGFSRKRDFDRLKDKYELFAKKNGREYRVPISRLLPEYTEFLKVDRRDFSPEDQVIKVGFDNGRCSILKKEQFYRILEAKVYSDFVGLFGEDKPNGLVQTEISKRVNLVTFRNVLGRTMVGGFAYLEPQITFSKLETTNKRLSLNYLDQFVNGTYDPIKYTSTLGLREHQNFSVGFDVNALVIDAQGVKSTFYADLGFRYGRTSITDSLRAFADNKVSKTGLIENYGVNTFEVYPKILWEVRADERYSFNFSWSHHWFYLLDNRFQQVASIEDFSASQQNPAHAKYRLNRVVLQANLKPNAASKGSLFFRYQFFWQQDYWKNNFAQAQVGYSFYLLSNRK